MIETGSASPSHTVQVGAAGTHYFVVQALNGVTNTAGNPAGSPSEPVSATVTIGASIFDTDPSPLTEAGLNGATLAVDLAGATYASSLSASQFTLTPAVSGLSVSQASRFNDERAILTLAFSGDLTADPAVIRNVTVVFKDGVGYDSPAMLADVRGRVGIS